jgi:hypothetical protein
MDESKLNSFVNFGVEYHFSLLMDNLMLKYYLIKNMFGLFIILDILKHLQYL